MIIRDGSLLIGISKARFSYSRSNEAALRGESLKPMLEKVRSRHFLSDSERESVQADRDRLITLRDRAKKAMEGATLSLAQRESCKKAVPILESKIKKLKEKLLADRLLRDCDDYAIPKHYQDRPR